MTITNYRRFFELDGIILEDLLNPIVESKYFTHYTYKTKKDNLYIYLYPNDLFYSNFQEDSEYNEYFLEKIRVFNESNILCDINGNPRIFKNVYKIINHCI